MSEDRKIKYILKRYKEYLKTEEARASLNYGERSYEVPRNENKFV